MGECENLANLKLTIKEIQRKLVEGCECAAKSFKSEYNGFSAEQCLLLGVGAMLFGALLGIQGFAFYKRAVLLVCDFCLSWLTILSPLRQVLALVVPT